MCGVRGAEIASTDQEVSKTPNQPRTEQLPRESYISNEYCTELHSAHGCTVQHGATNITQTAKVVTPQKKEQSSDAFQESLFALARMSLVHIVLKAISMNNTISRI